MFLQPLTITLLTLLTTTLAQDLGVPLTWRKFSNSRPLSERTQISQRAIDALLPQLDASSGEFHGIGYWQSGNVWSAMANHDRFTHGERYKAQVMKNLNMVFALRPNFDKFGYNDDALWWAQAAVYAYRAYGDAQLLSHAVDTWNRVSNFVVTPERAAAKSLPGKSFTIMRQCERSTMAGGVFWRPTSDDQSINSITTGLYLTLSASLAEITHEKKYTTAAVLSAQWIQNHNINADGIVLDSVNGATCKRSPSTWRFTYNSGKFLEGLSVLADVTGDAKWRSLMVDVIAAAVKSFVWQGEDGIITEGASPSSNNDGVGFKAIFIRGLLEAFERNASNTNLRILIHSYVDVQYNALLDLAASGDTYSAQWHGPAVKGLTAWGQMAALDVLTSAIVAN